MPFRTFFLCTLITAGAPALAPGQSPPAPPPPATPAANPAAGAAPAPSDSTPPAAVPQAAGPGREAQERIIREALQKLPPEKRRQVLQAMKSVWADEDVRAAREQLRQATENYRRTLRAAMEETDPEVRTAVRPLLDRLLKAGLKDSSWNDPPVDPTTPQPPSAPPSARPQDAPPRYLRLLGLSGEKLAALSPENRALISSVRDRVMADPRVRQATAALAAVSDQPRARAQAMQELRRITRQAATELEPRLTEVLPPPPANRP